MRILLDVRMYGLENSGIGRYLINLIKYLQTLDEKNEYIILLRRKYFNKLNFPNNWKKVLADFRHYSLSEQLKLVKIVKLEKPDLVHFPHFNVPIFSKYKFIVTLHDMTMHWQGINATNLSLPIYLIKRIPYKYIFSYAVKNSMKIIVPSKAVKNELINYYKINPEKIVVTYEGYDINHIVSKKSLNEKEVLKKYGLFNKRYFFYVGNAYPHKNLELVIQAILDINKSKNETCQFVIAGSRDIFMDRLNQHIIKFKAKKYVKLLGFVGDDELKIIYKHSLAFIYPSVSEGFGLQGLETIASGTLLLASDIPVFREIYKSHAFYFNPRDVKSISSMMFSILNMKSEDKYKFITKAQKFIKKYSWRKMARETIQIYENVSDQLKSQ